MIQRPYILAEKPQDYTGLEGQVITANVHSVSGAKKRKRSELAAAIDHQGINIYDIPSSKLITSYAVSPQADFTCAPCSIRCRRQGSGLPQRFTYCSITSPKPQIVCFSETASTRSSPVGKIHTFSMELGRETRPVLALETACIAGNDHDTGLMHKVLAIHEDGMVTCYSQDLGTEEWSTRISSIVDSMSELHVEHAMIISVEVARQAMLKGRDDILATLGNAGEESGGSLLLMMTRPSQKENANRRGALNLVLFSIENTNLTAQGPSMDRMRRLKLLSSMMIQEPSHVSLQSSTITVHPASATVYQEAGGVLAIYDFTSLIPRLVHELEPSKDDTNSYLRLSTGLVACSNVSSVSIIELPYYSIQAEHSLTDFQHPQDSAHGAGRSPQLRLLSYHGPSGLAVALHCRRLLAIQLSTTLPQDGASRKRKRDGLLSNAIGRGPSTWAKVSLNLSMSDRKIRSLGSYIAPSSALARWDYEKVELDQFALQGNADQFEAKAFSLLGIEMHGGNKSTLRSKVQSRIDQRVVYYILSRIFSLNESQQPGPNSTNVITKVLKIRILPRKIFDWLIERCLLTVANVERSLKHAGALSTISKLETGMLVRAFAERDSSLELLFTLIASPVPLGSGELVHILTMVTNDSRTAHFTENPYLVTNGEARSNDGDLQMQLTDGEAKQTLSSPPAASPEIQYAHRIFLTTMKKLYAIPSPSVGQALKSELSTSQLRTLVDALRMEIARSGWLSPYDDTFSANDQSSLDNHQLCHIAHLLNSAIDSIGTGGWILGTSAADDFSESADTLAYMKAEISAALEGIEEATYLKGMLEEILLCGKDTLHAQARPSKVDETQLMSVSTKPVTVPLEEVSNALPLGLKMGQGVSTTKVGAGGELIRRSKRDIGRLKSQMVGKYSFERIEI